MGGAGPSGAGNHQSAGLRAQPALRGGRACRLFLSRHGYRGLLEWLLQETRDSGVDIRLGEAFQGATQKEGQWTVDGANVDCRFLVGADGARSQVAKLLGLDRNLRYLKGVEYAYEPLPDAELSLHCFMDKHFAPGYIGWVLPGVGATQVGLACHSGNTVDLPGFIRRIDPLFGLSQRRILEKRGGIIPIGGLLRNFYREGQCW